MYISPRSHAFSRQCLQSLAAVSATKATCHYATLNKPAIAIHTGWQEMPRCQINQLGSERRSLSDGWPHLLTSMNPPVMVPFLLYWSPLMVTQLRWRASRVTLPAVSMSLHTMILPKICTPLS